MATGGVGLTASHPRAWAGRGGSHTACPSIFHPGFFAGGSSRGQRCGAAQEVVGSPSPAVGEPSEDEGAVCTGHVAEEAPGRGC